MRFVLDNRRATEAKRSDSGFLGAFFLILIDDRKGSAEYFVPSEPGSSEGTLYATDIPAMLFRLKSGDFSFSGNGSNSKDLTIGIELKSLYDLISSRTCGRLQGTQIRLMNATYDRRYLVYYGLYRVSKPDAQNEQYIELPFYDRKSKRNEWRPHFIGKQKVRHAYFEGIIAGLEEKGIVVKHFASGLQGFDKQATMTQIAYWIAERYRWYQREYESHTSMSGFDRSRYISKESLEAIGLTRDELFCANVANLYPRIGVDKAMALARHFKGSTSAMHNASMDEIAEIAIETRKGKGRTVRIGRINAKTMVAAMKRRTHK